VGGKICTTIYWRELRGKPYTHWPPSSTRHSLETEFQVNEEQREKIQLPYNIRSGVKLGHKNLFHSKEVSSSKDGLEVCGKEYTHDPVTTTTCSPTNVQCCNLSMTNKKLPQTPDALIIKFYKTKLQAFHLLSL